MVTSSFPHHDHTDIRIYGGLDGEIRVWDVERPGQECVQYPTFTVNDVARRNSTRPLPEDHEMTGIISTIHFNPDYSKMFAAGSYHARIGKIFFCDAY